MIKRIIPCLLISDGGLVKTVKFKNPKYVGDPINAVKIFNDKEVDELVVLDIYATKEKRTPDLQMIEDIVSEAFMPIAYGGGISSTDQIRDILKVGVEKVVLNKSAHTKPMFVKEAVKIFGSSTIVGGIDYKSTLFSKERVFTQNGKIKNNASVKEAAKYLETLGVGELFLNSIDRDGAYTGYDINLLQAISNELSIPIIASGGAGSLEDIGDLFSETNVNAAAAGSIFVFKGTHKAVLISYPSLTETRKILNQ